MIRWAIMALLAALPNAASAQGVHREGDWMLVCDNNAACTITGAPSAEVLPGYPRVVVRITRENRRQAPMLVRTRLVDEAGNQHPLAHTINHFSLSIGPDSAPLFTMQADPASGPLGDDYAPEQSAAMVDAMADHQPAFVRSGFGAFASMPVGDLARLVQRMDEAQYLVPLRQDPNDIGIRQERFGYELFPREQVDSTVAHPVFDRVCEGTDYSHARGYALDHTTVPTLFVHLTCGPRTFLYIWTPSAGGDPSPLDLPREVLANWSAMEASFSTDEGSLTITDHPPGRTDCGVRSHFGWVDGEGFVLLTQWTMPRCRAIQPADWPVSFSEPSWTVR